MRLHFLAVLLAVLGCAKTTTTVATPTAPAAPAASAAVKPKAEQIVFVVPNSMPLKTFMAQRPLGTHRFRVRAEVASLFVHEYRDAQPTHYVFMLTDLVPPFSLHAYAAKDSPTGRRLFELLKDGHQHNVTVLLCLIGPDGRPLTSDANLAAVVEVVSGS